jgi:flagellar biosynthesis protein FlhF
MNVRRFTARTSRDALILVRQALGEDAVVLSTKPSVGGVEVLAMAPEGMQQIERMAAGSAPIEMPQPIAAPVVPAARAAAPVAAKAGARSKIRIEPVLEEPGDEVDADVAQLGMSTLSFQDYVRERMLRRRQAALAPAPAPVEAPRVAIAADRASVLEQRMSAAIAAPAPAPLREPPVLRNAVSVPERRLADMQVPNLGGVAVAPVAAIASPEVKPQMSTANAAPVAAAVAAASAASAAATAQASAAARRDQEDMMTELRSMKGLIEERFGALAFIEKLQRQPAQARLTQKLLDSGFSPALIRKIGDSLPPEIADEAGWAANVLERNLLTAEADASIEDQGGVYAMVGATGVGKTTTTAKIAAAFAAKYGAANLGLITLDAYRIGAHEQLRAYGRILGVPVHTAHDRASLEDLLDLLAAKKMVLIDTAGMAQRDARTRELLDMLSHRSIRKLLVINAASQGETIEDVMISYHASLCAGVVLSKMDEAVKLGPAIDALIRHKVKVIGVANGQRVPEDWHRLSANALVHRALRAVGGTAYKLDASDVSLIFTAPLGAAMARRAAPVRPVHA